MKVRARLLLFGVAAPAFGLTAALLGAGLSFRENLLASIDRELRARAAVEVVGVREGEGLHLHLNRAPFATGLADFDPRGALYDEHGRLVMSESADDEPPSFGPHTLDELAEPVLWTSDGGRRELSVAVTGPSHRYVMRLSCSLDPLQQTLQAYLRSNTAVIAAVVLVLLALWTWLARSISERLEGITRRLPRDDNVPTWSAAADAPDDEIHRLDRALETAFARLRRAKESQDEFLAHAAHELRTPLGVMGAEIDLALKRERSADELRKALASSRREVERLAQLSTRLLDLMATGAVQLELGEVDLCRVLFEAVDAAEAAFDAAQVKIHVAAPERAVFRGDAQLLRQAIDNLLTNAIRHAPSGSTIHCEAAANEDGVQLDIADAGRGIPVEERERIFEPFVRGSRAEGQGSGLGLAIVRAIATRLGGRVEIVPSERGARFRLSLPV